MWYRCNFILYSFCILLIYGCDLDTGRTVVNSHADFITIYEGTKTCIKCHRKEALEIHASVHYQFKGDTSKVTNIDGLAGKLGGMNDFCIYPDINWIGKIDNVNLKKVDDGCGRCHVGLGKIPEPIATEEQLENIDCLKCHSDLYQRTVAMVDRAYQFVPDTNAMTVTILEAAQKVKRPGNDACLNCHTKAGGGNNFKRGDIEEAHRDATKDFDVHLAKKEKGGAGLRCIDCHVVVNHRFAGRGVDLRPLDTTFPLSCDRCHTLSPHENTKLNQHTARVYCTTCHIPKFAKSQATDMERDWSKPGDLDVKKGLYDPHMVQQKDVIPEYLFFNGFSKIYHFGQVATLNQKNRVMMAEPEGSINIAGSKIYAFKHHLGSQPIDPATRKLLPLKIDLFYQTGVVDEAIRVGTEAVGWPYAGHEFANVERYMGIFHEVAPKEQALTCNDCHEGRRLKFEVNGLSPRSDLDGMPMCQTCHTNHIDRLNPNWTDDELHTKVHENHPKYYTCGRCHGMGRLDLATLGYNPKGLVNSKPICQSCHTNNTNRLDPTWTHAQLFAKVHENHPKYYNCNSCHYFSKAQ